MFVSFEDAQGIDLVAGYVYGAGHNGNLKDDPIRNLFPKLGNQSGFRKKLSENARGRTIPGKWAYIALQTTGGVSEWPDGLDKETGIFTYYGDQHNPDKDIYETKQKGNLLLKEVFEWLHSGQYSKIPPFFVFENAEVGRRDTRFLGIAVPGNPSIPFGEDLQQARDQNGGLVNNLVAKFTVIDTRDSAIAYEWLQRRLTDLEGSIAYAPDAWKNFIENGLDGIAPLREISFSLDGETKKLNEKADNRLVEELHDAAFADAPQVFEYRGVPKEKAMPTFQQGHKVFPRDRQVSINALAHAGYKCEIDGDHPTFIRKTANVPYTEPHHLVPLAFSDKFDVSLDIEENIVSLCSNCHNQIHYGRDAGEILKALYEHRKDVLNKAGIDITLAELLAMYGIESDPCI